MTTTHTCPPIEEIAALLDGRLEKQDRLRVLQHLDECSECYEVFIGAAQFLEEDSAAEQPLEDWEDVAAALKGRVVKFPLGSSTAVRRWLPLAAAAALAFAIGVPVYRALFAPPRIERADVLVQSLGKGSDLQEHLWVPNASRGAKEIGARRANTFLVGVYLVDRQIRLDDGEPRRAAESSQQIGIALQSLRMEDEAGPFLDEWTRADEREGIPAQTLQREMTSAKARNLVYRVEENVPFPNFFAFGKWTETARIAAATNRLAFFEHQDHRRFPAYFLKEEGEGLKEEDQDSPIHQTLVRIEQILEGGPLEDAELDELARLLGRSGSDERPGVIEFFEDKADDSQFPGDEDLSYDVSEDPGI